MTKLKMIDETKAALFSFTHNCETTEQAQQELEKVGWSVEYARQHIDAAIRGGAYTLIHEVQPRKKEND